MLNIMQGGPMHNTIIETQDLVTDINKSWITEYKWTSHTITGSMSGKIARVWEFVEAVQKA